MVIRTVAATMWAGCSCGRWHIDRSMGTCRMASHRHRSSPTAVRGRADGPRHSSTLSRVLAMVHVARHDAVDMALIHVRDGARRI